MRGTTKSARRAIGHAGLAMTIVLVAACTAAASPSPSGPTPTAGPPTPVPTARIFTVTSSAFADEGDIPAKYTCTGEGVSPPLAWQGAPAETAAVAFVMEDLSADVVHWIVVDLPGGASGSLPEGFARSGDGRLQIKSYVAPCPAPAHRNVYYFSFYALSAKADLAGATTKFEVDAALRDKTIAYGWFSGYYALPD